MAAKLCFALLPRWLISRAVHLEACGVFVSPRYTMSALVHSHTTASTFLGLAHTRPCKDASYSGSTDKSLFCGQVSLLQCYIHFVFELHVDIAMRLVVVGTLTDRTGPADFVDAYLVCRQLFLCDEGCCNVAVSSPLWFVSSKCNAIAWD